MSVAVDGLVKFLAATVRERGPAFAHEVLRLVIAKLTPAQIAQLDRELSEGEAKP